jgi:hypothetical protein
MKIDGERNRINAVPEPITVRPFYPPYSGSGGVGFEISSGAPLLVVSKEEAPLVARMLLACRQTGARLALQTSGRRADGTITISAVPLK